MIRIVGFVLLSPAIAFPRQDKAAASRPGLVGEATDGTHRVVLVMPTPNFTLADRQSIHPQLSPDFSVVWTGLLKLARPGRYTIRADASVTVDGKDVQGMAADLKAGEHSILIAYRRPEARPARLQLVWESDFFKPEPIPSSALAHRDGPPDLESSSRSERGRALVEDLNCIACHKADVPGLRGRRGPDLSRVGSRTNVRWIAKWLEDPGHFRLGTAMPALLDAAGRDDVAAYLAGLKDPADKAKAAPADPLRLARGKELFERTGCAQCHRDAPGGVPLAGLGSKYEAVPLARYLLDPLKVDPSGRMPLMFLQEDEAAMIAEHLVQSKNAAFEADVPAGDPKRGKELVQSRGCVGCHTLNDGAPLSSSLKAPDLQSLSPEKGCLAEGPPSPAARYRLTREQRDDLRAFVRSFAKAPDRSQAPAHAFHRTVKAYRCTACHALDDATSVGLTEYPPALTDAGSKMRASWLGQVLAKKKRIRPWVGLRMPHFGDDENVAALVHGFAAAAGSTPGEGDPTPSATAEQAREGVKLIGTNGGLSCISCHDFKDRISLATRGPDMTEMFARMRPDWFRRWLRDPIRIQPGTAMPKFFGDAPGPDAEKKMDLIWAALSAGKNMPMPEGFPDPAGYLLLVKNEPITVRTFMPNASPRAIAVGLVGGLSFCYDAELCRLRYAWRGDFLDMAPVWGGRGGQPARVLGQRYYTAPDLFPLRLGDPEREPSKLKFRGYAFVQKIPEFIYEVEGVEVRERITSTEDGLGLTRTYTLAQAPGDVWYLAGDTAGVKLSSSAGEWQGSRLKVPGGDRAVKFAVTLKLDVPK